MQARLLYTANLRPKATNRRRRRPHVPSSKITMSKIRATSEALTLADSDTEPPREAPI